MSSENEYYKFLENEALTSFLQRLACDYGLSPSNIAKQLGYYPQRRLTDRGPGDFEALGAWLKMDSSALRRASESWLTTGADSISWYNVCPGWAFARTYDAYCPACLSESAHWRFDWLAAHEFLCRKHNILLLRECSSCLMESSTNCRYVGLSYCCPDCGVPFSEGVRIRPNRPLLDAADEIASTFERYHTAATSSDYAREVLVAWWVILRKLRIEDMLARSMRWVGAARKISRLEIPDFSAIDDQRPYLFAWRYAIYSRVACALAPACVAYLQGRNPSSRNQQFRYFLDHWSTEVIKGRWEDPAAS